MYLVKSCETYDILKIMGGGAKEDSSLGKAQVCPKFKSPKPYKARYEST